MSWFRRDEGLEKYRNDPQLENSEEKARMVHEACADFDEEAWFDGWIKSTQAKREEEMRDSARRADETEEWLRRNF